METMQDYHDVEEAMREGFKNMPIAGDSVDEAELESELNELLREGGVSEPQAEAAKPSAYPTLPPLVLQPVAEEQSNRVRVGKRAFDLSDLPEVPTGGGIALSSMPSTSSKSAAQENGAISLEERWKRLRMHAT